MEPVNAIWIGDELPPLQAACLKSFLNVGHRVVLHAYGNLGGVPAGIDLFDASRLMKREEVVRHKKTGSLALASDIYRFRLMQAGLGTYIDCDVVCLKPLPAGDYLFGWESNEAIGSAILRFPPGCSALTDMVAAVNDPYFIPDWYKPSKRRYLALRKAAGIPVHVSAQRWGVIGPGLVTHSAGAWNLIEVAQAIDVLYPVHWAQADLLLDAGLTFEDLSTPRTAAIHLWNANLKAREIDPASPLGSLLASV